MRIHDVAAFVLIVSGGITAGADEQPAALDVRGTIERGLEFIADEGLAWKQDRKCASCHEIPFMIWSMNEARRQGYPIEEDALREVTAWSIAPDGAAKVLQVRKPESTEKNVSHNVLVLELALQADSSPDPTVKEARQKFWAELQQDQLDDGSWALPPGSPAARPPLGGPKEIMTLETLLALTPPDGPAEGQPDPNGTARERGLKWVAAQKPSDDVQAIALRLLLATRLRRPAEELQPLTGRLLEMQNADGSWSPTPELSGNAYATGQTLYVLMNAGLDGQSPPAQRAREFLVKTQQKDGSWLMVPRPAPPADQPVTEKAQTENNAAEKIPTEKANEKEPDKGSKDAAPISYTATAWAIIGLVRSAPLKAR